MGAGSGRFSVPASAVPSRCFPDGQKDWLAPARTRRSRAGSGQTSTEMFRGPALRIALRTFPLVAGAKLRSVVCSDWRPSRGGSAHAGHRHLAGEHAIWRNGVLTHAINSRAEGQDWILNKFVEAIPTRPSRR